MSIPEGWEAGRGFLEIKEELGGLGEGEEGGEGWE